MRGGVQTTGLRELQMALQAAPREIRDEARELVQRAAEGAAQEMRQKFPRGKTGRLKASVTTRVTEAGEIVAVVLADAPHAHLVEFGTKRRKTKLGANRGRVAPATPEVVVPTAQRWRTLMFRDLLVLLRARGFEVNA